MKKTLLLLLLSTMSLSATTKPPAKKDQPYDADLFNKDEQVYSLHGSFLFWRVQEGALDYALKMNSPGPADGLYYATGEMEKATFDGEPGFRIAGSFFRAPHYWEIWGSYTRLTAAGTGSVDKPSAANEYVSGTWPEGALNDLSNASTAVHLNYNVADLLVDRYFIPNPHLRLRLIGGATVAWINQDWRVFYTDTDGEKMKIRNEWKYIGGGIRIGSMVDWFWGYDIYMTGTATTAILMGTYDNYSNQKQYAVGEEATIRNMHYSDARPVFSVQGLLGPSWQKTFSTKRVEVFVGYELNAWFNLQEVYRSTGSEGGDSKETLMNTGLVSLQGLTTRVTLDF